jgi:hypothetical protein
MAKASWSNPDFSHYVTTMLIGVALTFIFSPPQVSNFQAQEPFVPYTVPPATSYPVQPQPPAGTNNYVSAMIVQVQQQILHNDLRGAAKTVRLAREAQGQSAEFASLTCQIRILLGKPRSAVKACYAALTLPFHHDDAYWKANTYDGLASLFESTGDIGGAIQAAQKALSHLDNYRKGFYSSRVIQLLAKRATCADLQEAQKIANSREIPESQIVLIQSGIREWEESDLGKECAGVRPVHPAEKHSVHQKLVPVIETAAQSSKHELHIQKMCKDNISSSMKLSRQNEVNSSDGLGSAANKDAMPSLPLGIGQRAHVIKP